MATSGSIAVLVQAERLLLQHAIKHEFKFIGYLALLTPLTWLRDRDEKPCDRTAAQDLSPSASATMQSALHSLRAPTPGLSQQRRPSRSAKLVCRAQANPSLIGCHSQVWVGGWDNKDIMRSVEGTKKAGFDLIEGAAFAFV